MTFEEETFGPYEKSERIALKALEFYEIGKIPQAISELESALEINPANSSWHFNKALALDSINQFDDAINEYEIALELRPDDLEILNSLAIDYTRCSQYDLALNVFEHLEQLAPNFEPCYCNRIITYTEMAQHDLAEQTFYLAQQINPDCPLCYYNIGNSLFIRGQLEQAIRCWEKTSELEPNHPQINYRIAQACWSAGKKQHARHYFLADLRLDPGNIDCLFDFGLFLLNSGTDEDTEAAKEKFSRILELEPDFASAIFYLGEIAFNKKDYKRALHLFDLALETDDQLAGPRYRLAQYALMKGQNQRAKAFLISELTLAIEETEALISMGSMFLTLGKLDLATHCLLRALENTPNNADAYYYLGLVSMLKEEFQNAAQFFTHATDINPEHIEALKNLAFAHLKTGRLTEAQREIEKVIAMENSEKLKTLSRKIKIEKLKKQIKNFLWRL